MALRAAIDNPSSAARAAAILALVGVVNIPIIHFSVDWWNTLHQPASIMKFDKPSIHPSMLLPLLLMALGFTVFYFVTMLLKTRTIILQRESGSAWVRERIEGNRL